MEITAEGMQARREAELPDGVDVKYISMAAGIFKIFFLIGENSL